MPTRALPSCVIAALAAALLLCALAAPAGAAPIARPDDVLTDEDTAHTFDPLVNDTGGPVRSTVTISTAPIYGSASADPATGRITYTPEAHFNGRDFLHYQVCDAASACASTVVTLVVQPFGKYRLVATRNSSGVVPERPLQLLLPDGSGPRETLVEGSSAYFPQVSPDGAWLTFWNEQRDDTGHTTYSVGFQSTTDPTVGSGVGLPDGGLESWSWEPNGNRVVAVDGHHQLYLIEPPSVVAAEPKLMTYDIPDGKGGTVPVPVRGQDVDWGPRGIAFSDWDDWFMGPDGPTYTRRPGISTTVPDTTPALKIGGDALFPAQAKDGSLAYSCPGGICVAGPGLQTGGLVKGFDNSFVLKLHYSPDSSKLAATVQDSPGSDRHPYVMNADGGGLRELDFADFVDYAAWDPRAFVHPKQPWTRPGSLTYIDDAPPAVDPSTLKGSFPDASGQRGIGGFLPATVHDASLSPDGGRMALLLSTDTNDGHQAFTVEVADPDGGGRDLVIGAGNDVDGDVAWSPDGREIAFRMNTAAHPDGLYAIHPDGSGLRPIVAAAGPDHESFSPDGRWVVFATPSAQQGLFSARADGSAAAEQLPGLSTYNPGNPELSRRGDLVFTGVGGLWVARMHWGLHPTPVIQRQVTFADGPTAFENATPSHRLNADAGSWSPDGRALAFGTNDGTLAGRRVFVVNADGSRPARVSVDDTDHGYEGVKWGGAGPYASGLSPVTGPTAGGTQVTITGERFGGPGTTVAIGDKPATVTGGSATSITVTTPPHDAGLADVVVANPDGTVTSRPEGFTYTDAPAPHVTSVSPVEGLPAGGTHVTITGTGFGGPGTKATFGGVDAAVTGGSATSLDVTTPAHAAGKVAVKVTNADAQSTTLADAYTYKDAPPPPPPPSPPPPQPSAVAPATGPVAGGTAVTITGTGFGGPGTKAAFGGVDATVTGGSPTSLDVLAPAHAAGKVAVTVTNGDGSSGSLPDAYTYAEAPVFVVALAGPGATPDGVPAPIVIATAPLGSLPPPAAALSALSLSPAKFLAARSGASIAAATPGAKLTYQLNVPATVQFRVERAAAGRRVSGRCVGATRGNRRAAACTRYLAVAGRFTHAGAAGANTLRFTGRLGGHALSPRHYRLGAAIAPATATSAVAWKPFEILLP